MSGGRRSGSGGILVQSRRFKSLEKVLKMKQLLLTAAVVPFLLGARIQEPPKAPAGSVPSYRAEYLAGVDDAGVKLIELAEAMPAGKYSWRPAKDVRSVSEVFGHVAGSNYFLLTFVGMQPPMNLPEDMENITDKQRVVAELRRSIEYLRANAPPLEQAELEKPARMFGATTTRRGVYTTVLNHLHEHLGQSIAYARMNGVVPPWSR